MDRNVNPVSHRFQFDTHYYLIDKPARQKPIPAIHPMRWTIHYCQDIEVPGWSFFTGAFKNPAVLPIAADNALRRAVPDLGGWQ